MKNKPDYEKELFHLLNYFAYAFYKTTTKEKVGQSENAEFY